jgi:hypothetical protein
MKALLVGIALIGTFALATHASAEQRSREQCKAMAEKRNLHGGNERALNERNRFMANCMKGNLRKDKK